MYGFTCVRKGKKAQVTVFILLGIVLLIIFAFLFYTVSLNAQKRFAAEAEKATTEAFETSAIDRYITQCLSETTKEALKLSGEQGGPIYATQTPRGQYSALMYPPPPLTPQIHDLSELYGTDILPISRTDEDGTPSYTMNISYGIRQRSSYAGVSPTIYGTAPQYPYDGRLLPGFFGIPFGPFAEGSYRQRGGSLIPLCSDTGENARRLADKLEVIAPQIIKDYYDFSCRENYNPSFSIQSQLQSYIATQTDDCIEFSTITTDDGYTITQLEPASAGILLGQNDVRVLLEFPVQITKVGRPPVTRILYFTTKEDVRLKKIYYAAKNILREESNNVFFDMVHDSAGINCRDGAGNLFDDEDLPADDPSRVPEPCIFPEMNVERYKQVCTNPENSGLCPASAAPQNHFDYIDLLVINDSLSSIDGTPFVFQFAVENRRPALQLLDDGFRYLPPDPPAPPADPYHFHKVVVEGQTIRLAPEGFDPDEDFYINPFMVGIYGFGGWKDTTDSRFLFERCASHGCVPADHPEDPGYCGCDPGQHPEDPTYCIDCTMDPWGAVEQFSPMIPPQEWTRDEPFITDHRVGEYTALRTDTGAHLTTVSVCDDEWLCDHQDVSILVVDKPDVHAETINRYDEITQDVASIEDPLTLSGAGTSIGIGTLTNFVWTDLFVIGGVPTITILAQGQTRVLQFPTVPYTIDNIDELPAEYRFDQSEIGAHTITLSVQSDLPSPPAGPGPNIGNEDISLQVLECIPHRGIQDGQGDYSAPYPFNDIPDDDPFTAYPNVDDEWQANHACCEGDPADSTPTPAEWHNAPESQVCYDFTETTCRVNQGAGAAPSYPAGSYSHYFYPTAVPSYTRYAGHTSGDIISGDELGIWPATGVEPFRSTPLRFEDFGISGDAAIDPRANDVYQRSFNVRCSGERGNVCDGAYDDYWDKIDTCSEAEYCSWNDNTCNPWPYVQIEPTDNYICNMALKCVSSFSSTGYSTSGSILARAVASGNEQCLGTVGYLSPPAGPGGIANTRNVVAPAGVLQPDNGNVFASVDCNYYDHYDIVYNADGTPQQRISRACDGTCGAGAGCFGRDYSCSTTTNPDSCTYVPVNPDSGEEFCEDDCRNQYYPGGSGEQRCCGDDAGEGARQFEIYRNRFGVYTLSLINIRPAQNGFVCCQNTNQCVYDNGPTTSCITPGSPQGSINVDGASEPQNDYCMVNGAGAGQWADCNTNGNPLNYCPDQICRAPQCTDGDCSLSIFRGEDDNIGSLTCTGGTGCQGQAGCSCNNAVNSACGTTYGPNGQSQFPRDDCIDSAQRVSPDGTEYACCSTGPTNQCWTGNNCVDPSYFEGDAICVNTGNWNVCDVDCEVQTIGATTWHCDLDNNQWVDFLPAGCP